MSVLEMSTSVHQRGCIFLVKANNNPLLAHCRKQSSKLNQAAPPSKTKRKEIGFVLSKKRHVVPVQLHRRNGQVHSGRCAENREPAGTRQEAVRGEGQLGQGDDQDDAVRVSAGNATADRRHQGVRISGEPRRPGSV